VDRKEVADALAAIETHADLFKSYQRLHSQHIAAMTGIAGSSFTRAGTPSMAS